VRSVTIIAATATLLAGCGNPAHPRSGKSDVRKIVGVLESARRALLNDRSHEACGLLTAHGRDRVLGFQVDFAREGTRVPSSDPRLPQTCEAVIERERDDASEWIDDLRRVRFSVVSIRGSTAHAKLKVLKPYGPVIEFSLRKTPAGWRIDDSSNGVPVGY
jgi:hypothetical protein